MSDSTAHLVAAAMCLVPSLVWGILAREYWDYALRWYRRTDILLSGAVATLLALLLAINVVFQLLPPALRQPPSTTRMALMALQDVTWVSVVALFRHSARYASVIGDPPSRAWLAANYGAWALAAVAVLLGDVGLVPNGTWATIVIGGVLAYLVGMVGLATRSMLRYARRGRWRAAGVGEPRYLDGVMMIAGTACLLASVVVAAVNGGLPGRFLQSGPPPVMLTIVALQAFAGLVFASPLVARLLGTVVERLLVAVSVIAATAAVWVGGQALGDGLAGSGARTLADVAAIGGLIVVLGPGRTWLTDAIERVVFHRSRQRRAELDEALRVLTPELGTMECCRRALAAVVRIMQLRDAAILLATGETLVHGSLAIAPLARTWPRDAGAPELPSRVALSDEIGLVDPALLDALIAADVAIVVPITSPRQRWGDLFASTDLLSGALLTWEEAGAWDGFADQLARVLDAADLLARAVAVERSLAHAEKLAAIGETAARIAHEIRNPVTAARSLAQQLAREPVAPFKAEHEIILGELERVERQVAALLRFSRREEYRLEPVDLGELVRTTLDAFRPRLAAARVGVALDVADGVCARADREKVRQVLVNLFENALDALDGADGDRQLAVAVTGDNGSTWVRVADTGPGVPADALPRLFEPFFSRKEKGTGLGLAIAKQTVDAHGGRIAASCAGRGMTFEVELPQAGGA